MKFIQYNSQNSDLYTQSVALRNHALYGDIGMPPLSEDGKQIEKENLFFGAVTSDRLVGTVSFYELSKGHFQLVSMAIDATYQAKGTGTKLVNFAFESMIDSVESADDGQSLNLVVTTNAREKALHFYERLGFISDGAITVDPAHHGIRHLPMKNILLVKNRE